MTGVLGEPLVRCFGEVRHDSGQGAELPVLGRALILLLVEQVMNLGAGDLDHASRTEQTLPLVETVHGLLTRVLRLGWHHVPDIDVDRLNEQSILRVQGGSYSSRNLAATIGLKKSKTKAVFYQNLSESKGYRNHSKYKQQVFNTRVWHDFSDSSQIRWQFNYAHSPYAFDSGGINIDMVEDNRTQARPQNESFKTYETVNHLKTGIQWEKKISQSDKITYK